MSMKPPEVEKKGIDTVVAGIACRDDLRTDNLTKSIQEISSPSNAHVILVHIFDSEDYSEIANQLLPANEEYFDPNDLAQRVSPVRQIIDSLNGNVSVEVRGVIGNEKDSIVSIAEETNADRVVVGGQKRSPTNKVVFGSTAQHVVLNAPCPVTFVRDQE